MRIARIDSQRIIRRMLKLIIKNVTDEKAQKAWSQIKGVICWRLLSSVKKKVDNEVETE